VLNPALLGRPELWGLLLAVGFFAVWPTADLEVASWFYVPGSGFPLAYHPLLMFLYHGTQAFLDICVVSAVAVLALTRSLTTIAWRRRRRAALMFLYCAILGPGLIVNGVLKEHWGRARPFQVQDFGGPALYSSALIPSDQCKGNCSFVSGHASVGFLMMSLAFMLGKARREWLFAGILCGALVGLGRMMQGRHFLSDIVFCGFLVWYSVLAVEYALRYFEGRNRTS
jgi:lipid A 4'-phosphatase